MKTFIQKLIACETNNIAIAHAILWAAVILATSWLTRGTDNAETVLIIMIGAASSAILFNHRKTNTQ